MSEHKPTDETPTPPLTGKQAYNLVTDTVGGPNLRLKDNLLQGAAMLVGLLLGAAIGYFVMATGVFGAIVGAIIGAMAGLFGSGLYLMIYRAVKHARGEHD